MEIIYHFSLFLLLEKAGAVFRYFSSVQSIIVLLDISNDCLLLWNTILKLSEYYFSNMQSLCYANA